MKLGHLLRVNFLSLGYLLSERRYSIKSEAASKSVSDRSLSVQVDPPLDKVV